MISRERAQRILWRIHCGEIRKTIAASENVCLSTVYNVERGRRKTQLPTPGDLNLREPTRRCPGCGSLLHESVETCLQCRIESLRKADLHVRRHLAAERENTTAKNSH